MRTCIQRGLYGVLLAGGVVVLGAGAATAADQSTGTTTVDAGLGAAVTAPLSAGTTSSSIIGETVAVLGGSVDLPSSGGVLDGGLLDGGILDGGILNGGTATGNVIAPEVVVPVNVGCT
ncbi:hypothetical protein ACX80P_06090, partial [Arthrobacter sp. TMS1-12-1]